MSERDGRVSAEGVTRRGFLASAAAASAVGAAAATAVGSEASRSSKPMTMKFAPHFGMFGNSAGGDMVAQLEFAADQGFTAWEDNGMAGRSVEDQTKVAAAMDRLGMTMGVFVVNMSTAWGPSFSRNDAGERDKFLDECRVAAEVGKRVNAKWATVVCGTRHPRIDLGYQTAYAIDQLRRGAEILEPSGLVMVLEPLNPRDHPNMLLAEMGHAFEICRAVDSPSCKILCDLYHQQIAEGNLIPNIDRSWSEIAYFQIGDNPGRNEPTTGEINFAKVFEHIHAKGYTGVMGMEHGNSKSGKDGEQAVIDAYRSVDPA